MPTAKTNMQLKNVQGSPLYSQRKQVKYDIVISVFEETLRKLLQMTAIGLHFPAMPRVSCHGIIKELETSRISSSCNMTSPIMNQFFNI